MKIINYAAAALEMTILWNDHTLDNPLLSCLAVRHRNLHNTALLSPPLTVEVEVALPCGHV